MLGGHDERHHGALFGLPHVDGGCHGDPLTPLVAAEDVPGYPPEASARAAPPSARGEQPGLYRAGIPPDLEPLVLPEDLELGLLVGPSHPNTSEQVGQDIDVEPDQSDKNNGPDPVDAVGPSLDLLPVQRPEGQHVECAQPNIDPTPEL